jgi:fatty acid omega-hydroxylase
MKAAAAAVLARFRVEVLPGQAEAVKPKLNTTLYMKRGLMVRFAAREQRHEPVPAAGGCAIKRELPKAAIERDGSCIQN